MRSYFDAGRLDRRLALLFCILKLFPRLTTRNALDCDKSLNQCVVLRRCLRFHPGAPSLRGLDTGCFENGRFVGKCFFGKCSKSGAFMPELVITQLNLHINATDDWLWNRLKLHR